MIQFNMLPDVKIKYIKVRRQKRMIMLISFLTSAGSLALVALMLLFIFGVQGAQLAIVNDEIEESSNSIRDKRSQVDDINKVLTVQNQLNSLDALHSDKPRTSRLFEYLTKLQPSGVILTKLNLITSEGSETIKIQGTTTDLATINQFIDTLKFSKFKTSGENGEENTAFTEVVLSQFTRDKAGASYTIDAKYFPGMFDSSNTAAGLIVPEGLTTTRSEQGRPILQTAEEAEANPQTEETE